MKDSTQTLLPTNTPEFISVIDKLKKVIVKKQALRLKSPIPVPATNLLIGNYTHSINPKLLEENNVKLVISCVNIDNRDLEESEKMGIFREFVIFKDQREVNIVEKIEQMLVIMNRSEYRGILKDGNSKILVNCFSGKSRSVALVLGYLIKNNNLTFQEAVTRLSQKCDTSEINPGFFQQLKIFAIEHQKQVKQKQKEDDLLGLNTKTESEKENEKEENYQLLNIEDFKNEDSSRMEKQGDQENRKSINDKPKHEEEGIEQFDSEKTNSKENKQEKEQKEQQTEIGHHQAEIPQNQQETQQQQQVSQQREQKKQLQQTPEIATHEQKQEQTVEKSQGTKKSQSQQNAESQREGVEQQHHKNKKNKKNKKGRKHKH